MPKMEMLHNKMVMVVKKVIKREECIFFFFFESCLIFGDESLTCFVVVLW